MIRLSKYRPGVSLVEMLLFLGFFALVSGVVVALLFSSSEQRVRQEAIADVDQSGIQLLQTFTRRIRRAERILDPARGATGSILFLQMAQDSENPTIIAQGSGVILVAEANSTRPLTGSGNVVATNFLAYNTSPAVDKQSVFISFTISKTVPLTTNPKYSRTFEALISLFPDDQLEGNCGCTPPVCNEGSYRWGYCQTGSCSTASAALTCNP